MQFDARISFMSAPRRSPRIRNVRKRSIPATVIRDPAIMNGPSTARGARVQVAAALSHLHAEYTGTATFNACPGRLSTKSR
jgi:hypothetical protein